MNLSNFSGLAGILCLIVVAPMDGSAQTLPDTPEVLRPGDEVRVAVWRQPEFSGQFVVTDEGVLAHPLLQEVTVAWRPVSEVQDALRTYLLDYEADPSIVVEPFFRVAVGGEVRSPSVHLLRPGTTLPEAIAAAGGFAEEADPGDLDLRRGAADYELDLRDPDSPYVVTTVRSGDQIVVGHDPAIFRDYILPAVTFIGSFASIYRVFDR